MNLETTDFTWKAILMPKDIRGYKNQRAERKGFEEI